MGLWYVLQDNVVLALIVFGLLGLCIGSFLNVVIYRTPLAMYCEWRAASIALLAEQEDIPDELLKPIVSIVAKDQPITLSYPASHCPRCSHKIKWYENIPLISWLVLMGKCSYCQQSISIRYPFIEVATSALSVLIIYQFGVTLPALSALVLVWTLIALIGIDFDTQLLPDRLTFPLAGLGLAVNSQSWFITPSASIWGVIIGYLSLWVVVKIFYIFTKKQGMGEGDFKLLAVMGAWLGVIMLPFIILLSSLLGVIVGAILIKKHGESRPFAFGPYIAIAGIIALLYGQPIMTWYIGQYT